MKSEFFRRFTQHLRILGGATAITMAVITPPAWAEARHGIAMYGEPALPADFTHLPQTNPDAPKGGKITIAESGSFDSLHPVIRKGRAPWQLRHLLFESLLGRSYDEPFTLYGLLAETVETGPNREWVEFTLRGEARFSDGAPVSVEDVMWSYETLGTIGHPRYHSAWKNVEKMEQTGPRSIRFTFKNQDLEAPLIMGLRPILQKAQWAGKDFTASGIDVLPIGSSPYVLGDFEPTRYFTLKRNPDYWGKDLPFMRGKANFDEIRVDYYGDSGVVFEAFKAGEASLYNEGNAEKWATQYSFPAAERGDIVLSEIPHKRPTGITGFVMNTRSPIFADWRVREAMIQAFNFEYINQTLTGGREPRINSYFSNSVLGMEVGAAATGRVAELLTPFKADLIPGTLEGYALPQTDGSARNRAGTAAANALLEEAGWVINDTGKLVDAQGTPFAFEMVLNQGAQEMQTIMDAYLPSLERLGMEVKISVLDDAQYTDRTNSFDFDMAPYARSLSLSPGNEQKLYWGSALADENGSRNWMGVKSPAIDAMIEAMLTAQSQEDFRAATKGLDRLLTAGRYVIPLWYSDVSRVAHKKEIHFPEYVPMYGNWLGYMPDVWWYEE